MLMYNVRIALKSLKRSPILSAVIVGGVMLGITVSTIFATIRHSFAKDPIPQKSSVLFYVRMDNWDPLRPYVPEQPTIPPTQITYRDMRELMKSSIPVRQTGMFKALLWVSAPAGQPAGESSGTGATQGAPTGAAPPPGAPASTSGAATPAAPATGTSSPPAAGNPSTGGAAGPTTPASGASSAPAGTASTLANGGTPATPSPSASPRPASLSRPALRPERVEVRLCFADFFTMFQVPFLYGSGWDDRADEGPEQVVVLSREQNEKLFGGVNSVGRIVRIQDRDFKVVGVIAHWRPSIRFYDLTQQYIAPPEKVFIPFNHMPPMNISTAGNSDGWKSAPGTGQQALFASETCWIQFWVELPTEVKHGEYEDFLTAYVMEQKKAGRFGRPLNNRVTPVLAWMTEQGVVPNETNAMAVVSLLFLAVCSLNLMGLLLGKFLARAPEVGVRRALGARRRDIFVQHIIECEIVGAIGGMLGIVLSAGGLVVLNAWMMNVLNRGDLFRIDVPMTVLAIGLSLLAGLIAGLYPAWRICRIQPAVHLKVQ